MADQPRIDVVEFTDPGCSWAWGTEPKLRLLRWSFGDRLSWRRVMGTLIGDMENFTPDFDPVRAAERQPAYWANVSSHTGMPYPARLQYMYRSTEPGCRAVKAAEVQGEELAQRVLRRLRESTFVFGTPADTDERIVDSIRGIEGLDADRLPKDAVSEPVQEAFLADFHETRRPNDYVMNLDESPATGGGKAKNTEGHWRYVFPTVVFSGPNGEVTVPGWKPYERYVEAMEAVSPGSTGSPKNPPSKEQVFATWGTAAPKELEILCGDPAPPSGVVTYDWGDGEFYLSAAEAAARGVGA